MGKTKDKAVLITGSTKGIGLAIARNFIQSGYTVGINGRNPETVEAICTSLQEEFSDSATKSSSHIFPIPGDISSAPQVQSIVQQVQEKMGSVYALINNAGITQDKLLLRMGEADWDAVLNVNLRAVFLLTKAIVRPMLRQGFGRIINISSVVGETGNPGQANYAAAKAGLIGFTKALARELATKNITVNAVAPGFIDTEMTKKLDENYRNRLLQSIPLGRLAKADEVAAAVLFLASDQAAYITGQSLGVNGGMHM